MNDVTTAARRASDVLYEELVASRNSVRRTNAALVKQACDQLEKAGIPISIADVVRRCGPDGPAYSTISNTGSALGEYVKLRVGEQATPRKDADGDRSLADKIADPVLQAQVRDRESQSRWLHKENVALRALLKTLSPAVDIDAAIKSGWKGSDTFRQIAVAPTAAETGTATAILKLLDHLVGSRQYSLEGGRLTVNKKVVLDKSDTAALRSSVGLANEDWLRRYGLKEDSRGQR